MLNQDLITSLCVSVMYSDMKKGGREFWQLLYPSLAGYINHVRAAELISSYSEKIDQYKLDQAIKTLKHLSLNNSQIKFIPIVTNSIEGFYSNISPNRWNIRGFIEEPHVDPDPFMYRGRTLPAVVLHTNKYSEKFSGYSKLDNHTHHMSNAEGSFIGTMLIPQIKFDEVKFDLLKRLTIKEVLDHTLQDLPSLANKIVQVKEAVSRIQEELGLNELS